MGIFCLGTKGRFLFGATSQSRDVKASVLEYSFANFSTNVNHTINVT